MIQKDMMMPAAVRSYADNIGKSVAFASEGAPACGSAADFASYMNRCSFDMFTAAFLGKMTQTANPENPDADPEDVKFCEAAVGALNEFFPLVFS